MGDEGGAEPLGALPALRPHGRLEPGERRRAAGVLAGHYEHGATIQGLADASGYSFRRVRELLQEAGVTLRRRGGYRPRAR